ncbi:MAG: DUF5119 domain-containing protein [Muribaculaceae bacterium]|nr:DUF5119 domain-containing protein [Muribaculaceae bacterium]
MKRNRTLIWILGLVMLPILSACRKDLCYNHYAAIDFQLNWEQEWERDYGAKHPENWDASKFDGTTYDALRPERPEWVSIIEYSDEENPEERFLNNKGGEVIIDGSSRKSFLLYNGDTEYIVISDIASLTEARATATSRSRSSIAYINERHPNVRSMNPPDVLYAAYLEDVPEVKFHELCHLPVKMQPLVYTYVIRYEFESGQEHISQARGALGGMAESVYLRNGVTSEESAIILYDCKVTSYGCEARVRTFGVPGFPDIYYGRAAGEAAPRPFSLNLEVLMFNGKTKEFNFDISDQIANQPRGGVIVVKDLKINDEDALHGSGFQAEVDGWGKHEVVDLPVHAE